MPIESELEPTVLFTAYYTEPARRIVVKVPAHFSLIETREAIHSAISKELDTRSNMSTGSPLTSLDSSSIIKASRSSGVYEANTPIGQIVSDDKYSIHAIVPRFLAEPEEKM